MCVWEKSFLVAISWFVLSVSDPCRPTPTGDEKGSQDICEGGKKRETKEQDPKTCQEEEGKAVEAETQQIA